MRYKFYKSLSISAYTTQLKYLVFPVYYKNNAQNSENLFH